MYVFTFNMKRGTEYQLFDKDVFIKITKEMNIPNLN